MFAVLSNLSQADGDIAGAAAELRRQERFGLADEGAWAEWDAALVGLQAAFGHAADGGVWPRWPPYSAPSFGHAGEAFVTAHATPGAWAGGTAAEYRQTLAAIGARLAGTPPAASVSALGAPDGGAALRAAFTAAFSRLAPATRARHLAALRSVRLVAGGGVAGRRPGCRVGAAEGHRGHDPGAYG